MTKPFVNKITLFAVVIASINFVSCKKDSGGGTTNPDVCAGKTIVITTTIKASTTCVADGQIEVSATGSTGFTYKLGSTGTYGATTKFTDLVAGDYTVYAKDGAGCEKTVVAKVTAGGTAGAKFAAVKSLMASKCQSCHNSTQANGGMNWTVDCNIVKYSARIKVRAVDEGTMPPTGPLTQDEKNIITDWIAAGGAYGN
jgi:hypothetical protein